MQKHITIGVAGHVGYGKTSLANSLNKNPAGSFKKNKQQNDPSRVSIIPWDYSDNPAITFIDVPGHVNFFINAVRGLSPVDMAVLVVAADDGVMPQTIEHLNILNFFKVKKGFIVITKTDLADEEILEFAELKRTEKTEKGSIKKGVKSKKGSSKKGSSLSKKGQKRAKKGSAKKGSSLSKKGVKAKKGSKAKKGAKKGSSLYLTFSGVVL